MCTDIRWVRVRVINDPSRIGIVPENYLSLATLSAQDAETREFLLLQRAKQQQQVQKTDADSDSVPWNASHLASHLDDSLKETSSPLEAEKDTEFELLFDFIAQTPGELSVKQGQHVWSFKHQAQHASDVGWLRVVDSSGRTGLVPESYVKPLSP